MRRYLLASVSLVFFLFLSCSCSNIQSQYDKGRYNAVIKAVDRMKNPTPADLLLKAKSHINLGSGDKALESLLLYLLEDETHNAPDRAFAVSHFIALNSSDPLSVMVMEWSERSAPRIATVLPSLLWIGII